MMVTAARGAGAARMRNCIASYFGEERNNGSKWIMSIDTQIRIYSPHDTTEHHKFSSGNGLGSELRKFHQ